MHVLCTRLPPPRRPSARQSTIGPSLFLVRVVTKLEQADAPGWTQADANRASVTMTERVRRMESASKGKTNAPSPHMLASPLLQFSKKASHSKQTLSTIILLLSCCLFSDPLFWHLLKAEHNCITEPWIHLQSGLSFSLSAYVLPWQEKNAN